MAMAGKVRNDELSSLPPNYVSLAQLRDIWMKKQEEKKLKEKEEEERKQAEEKRKQEEEEKRKQEEELGKQVEEKRNDGRGYARIVVRGRVRRMGYIDEKGKGKEEHGHRKMGGGYARIVVRGRVSRMDMIDEKGKGKEVIVGGYGNVEGYGKKGNGSHFRDMSPAAAGDERNRNEVEKEKMRVEKRINNGKEMVLVEGGISVGERMEFRGGFRKYRKNRGPYGWSRNERVDRLNQLKQNEGASDFRGGMLKDDKGYNEKRGVRGRNSGGYVNRHYRLKESRVTVLKGNGVEPETVKKGKDEIVENEGASGFGGGMLGDKRHKVIRGERGRNSGGYLNRDNRLKDSRDAVLKGKGVEPETVKKGEDEIVEVLGESSGVRRRGRNQHKGRNGEYRRRYNKVKESRDAVLIKLETGKKAEDEILEIFNEKCCLAEGARHDEEKRKETSEVKIEGEGSSDARVALESKVGDGVLRVRSVKNGEKEGVGKGKKRNRKGRYNRFKESRDTVLIGNELELETEKKSDDDILEVFNEKDRNEDKKQNGTNEDRAEGKGSSDDRVAVESKVDDGFLMVESVKNGEKEGEGEEEEYRRLGNWKGKAKDEVFNEKCCLSEGDKNEEEKGNRTNEGRVEGEGSSDDRVAVESKVGDGILTVESKMDDEVLMVENKVDDGVLTVESKVDDGVLTVESKVADGVSVVESKVADGVLTVESKVDDGVLTVESKVEDGVLTVGSVKNGEKEGAGKGHRRHGNLKRNYGEKRRYAMFGRYNDRQKMMWVKKDEKSGADSGSSGVQNIESN